MKKAMIVMLVCGLMMSACSRINPGNVGIKVINGGSDRGVGDFPIQVGWVFYNPVTTSVFEYPTFVQTAVWTQNPGEGHPANEEITFTNKDQMTISADINLSYHLEKDRVPAFYVKFRSDALGNFTYGYLHNLARDAFNEHAGKYDIAQIMGDNANFLSEVRKGLQDAVTPLGVVIDQFGLIGAPRPPQAVIDAINSKVHSTQLAQQKENELRQAEADAKKVVAKAEGDAKATTVWAEAQANANRKLSESITGNLLTLKQLEKWDGHLPYINGGSTNPFVSVERK